MLWPASLTVMTGRRAGGGGTRPRRRRPPPGRARPAPGAPGPRWPRGRPTADRSRPSPRGSRWSRPGGPAGGARSTLPSSRWTALCSTPRRSDDSDRVGLNSMVRSRISSKDAKLSGPARKAAMSELFSRVTPGVMSMRASFRTRPGWARARAMEVAPPRDIPTTSRAAGASTLDDHGHVLGHGPGIEHGIVAGPVRVPVPGQVDGHQGPVEGQGHRVPGVGVLPPPWTNTDVGRIGPPHQGTDPPARGHLHELPPHGGGPVPGQPDLAGVLLEERELVVVAGVVAHAGPSSPVGRRTPAQRRHHRPQGLVGHRVRGVEAHPVDPPAEAGHDVGGHLFRECPPRPAPPSTVSSITSGISSHRPALDSRLSSGWRSSHPSTSSTGR